MSGMIAEIYDVLRQAGVDERLAKDAASAVMGSERMTDLVTKREFDLLRTEVKAEFAQVRAEMKTDIAELKAALIKWNLGAMAVLTSLVAAIVRLG